jgi:hypothetical protein
LIIVRVSVVVAWDLVLSYGNKIDISRWWWWRLLLLLQQRKYPLANDVIVKVVNSPASHYYPENWMFLSQNITDVGQK